MSISAALTDLFQIYPRLSIASGDMATYRGLRHAEPNLVSIVDGMADEDSGALDALVLSVVNTAIGTVSYLVQENPHKSGKRNRFARIDLVITAGRYRTLGVGRALLLCVIVQLLREWGEGLYSISCLAAHPAVVRTLQNLDFKGVAKEDLNYVHEELKLEDRDIGELTEHFAGLADAALKKLNFNLRQRDSNLRQRDSNL